MKNQISASLTLDVSSLADAIAERLQRPAEPALTVPQPSSAATTLGDALSTELGLQDWDAALRIVERLRMDGYVLAKLPATPAEPARDWFTSTD